MRAVVMGILEMWVMSLIFRMTNTDTNDIWVNIFLLLIFAVCAMSQLIKQFKE
ncbi:hypothetical protein [Staphylococcus succinus]|uniref:hypothetical protein n=1 Tax=Staphylococcus succinus TaxID=61015 RepID=UPI001C059B2E|nr:hypothetical protein [Staphylococcus succinus]MBU0437777.1 hypothetical protein [Staphylococcus succinus]